MTGKPIVSLYRPDMDERMKEGIREVGRLAERLGVQPRVPCMPYDGDGYSFLLMAASGDEPTWELSEVIAAAHAYLDDADSAS